MQSRFKPNTQFENNFKTSRKRQPGLERRLWLGYFLLFQRTSVQVPAPTRETGSLTDPGWSSMFLSKLAGQQGWVSHPSDSKHWGHRDHAHSWLMLVPPSTLIQSAISHVPLLVASWGRGGLNLGCHVCKTSILPPSYSSITYTRLC